MANLNDSLDQLMTADASLCAALVDSSSGMLLGSAGGGLDMELAAAGNTEVVRAKYKTIALLGLSDAIDDILITLDSQYHIIRPIRSQSGLFLYLVLDKKGNLALARRKMQEVEQKIEI